MRSKTGGGNGLGTRLDNFIVPVLIVLHEHAANTASCTVVS